MRKPTGKELREAPAYGVGEAARHLSLPTATLGSWVLGRNYTTQSGERRFTALIEIADRQRRLLSFLNLVEAHVLV